MGILYAQTTTYPIKIVKGVEYYVYSVQSSEGLYAISRKFNISKKEIEENNPEVANGIVAGQQLLIPVAIVKFKKNIVNTSDKTTAKIDFLEHIVEKKQTLFAVSNLYNVTQEEILKYNPTVKDGLKEGMTLLIPTNSLKNKVSAKVNDKKNIKDTVIKHKVQAGETLYSISKKYEVTIDEIVKQNPIAEKGLTVGTELTIIANSGSKKMAVITGNDQNNTVTTSISVNNPSDKETTFFQTKTIKLAFLLPFMLDNAKTESHVERFVDFYTGALLAIDNWKRKGVSFEIFTYDTQNSDEAITQVLNNSDIKTMDLIIGPAYSSHVTLVSEFAKENQINILIPFTSKVPEIDTNPYLFQFNPGNENETRFLINYLSKLKNVNIVLAEIKDINIQDEGNVKFNEIKKALLKNKNVFSTILLTTPDLCDFSTEFKNDMENIVIFNTDKYAYVNPYLVALRLQTNAYDITLMGQYSWRNQNLQLPKFKYVSPFETNSKLLDNKEYSKQYVKYLQKDLPQFISPRYDLLGFDLSNYFIAAISKYGKKYNTKLELQNYSEGIQSQPFFERVSATSGYINQKLYLGEDIYPIVSANE